MELDILQSKVLQHLRRLLTKIKLDHLVFRAVTDEEWRLLIRIILGNIVLDPIMEQQVARETKYTTQLLLVRETREQGHRSTLRESSEDDSRGLDALIDLLLDKGVEVIAGAKRARLVLVADGFLEVQLNNCQSSLPT